MALALVIEFGFERFCHKDWLIENLNGFTTLRHFKLCVLCALRGKKKVSNENCHWL